MTNVGYATLSVIPSMTGFQSSLTRGIDPAMTSAGKRAGSRFGSSFMGTLGALGVFSAASGALRFLGDSVAEGREAVKVGAQTRAVIKSTGGVARVSEKQVGRLANQLSRMGGIDDEIVQAGANILLTFKNVRNEAGEGNKVFDEANKAALNLSVAMDTDLSSAALKVGKALNDPVAGMTALGRAGVQFSADQKDAIKDFVATGDTLSAQKVILKELDSQFAGSAKAQRTEADRLSVSWGNFKEEIGTALIPVLDDLAKFMRKEGIPKAKEFFGVVQDEGVPAMKKVAGFAKDAGKKVKGLVDGFRDLPGWVQKVLAGGVIGGTVAVKLGAGDLFKRGATPLNPLYVSAVGGGLDGPGGKSGFLNKLGIFGAVLAPAAVGLNELHDFHRGDDKNALAGLGRGGINEFLDDKLPTWLGGDGKQKVEEFNRKLSDTQAAFATSKAAANDYFMFIKNGHPTEASTRFTVTGVDTAKAEIQSYLDLLARVSAHVDSRLDAAGGSGPTTPTGGKAVDPTKRGVNVNINGRITVNGTRELERIGITKAHQAALGGFGG